MTRATPRAIAIVSSLFFAAAAPAAAQSRGVGNAGITIFADRDFRGESATFRNDVSDLTKYHMNDVVSSLRVARGETWEVCVDKNYKGRCQTFTGDQANLATIGWEDTITAIRRVRNAPPAYAGRQAIVQPRITFFDGPGYRGASRTITDGVASLGFFSNRAGSIRVDSGAWEVCDGPRWTGRCVVVSRDVPDLARFDLDGQISSARPRAR